MKHASAPTARRRGSSAGTGKSSGTRSAKKCNTKSPRSPASPTSAKQAETMASLRDKAFSGAISPELLAKYADIPEPARSKMIMAEVSGRGFDLKYSDIMPKDSARSMVTGDMYQSLESALAALGTEYTPLQFHLTVMRHKGLPYSVRSAAAKEAMAYVHPRNPETPDPDAQRNAVLIVPAAIDLDTWEREATKAQRVLAEQERKRAEATGNAQPAPPDQS